MSHRFDRQQATAQARFDRLEDQVAEAAGRQDDPDTDENGDTWPEITPEAMPSGMHLTDGDDGDLADDDAHHEVHEAVAGDAVMDALVEVFNDRDLDSLLELCREDCEVPGLVSGLRDVGPAVADLWERRPSITLTRVVDDGQAVGVLWERVASERWGSIGTVHGEVDGERLQVLQFSDDLEVLDRLATVPPDGEDPLWDDLDGRDDTPE